MQNCLISQSGLFPCGIKLGILNDGQIKSRGKKYDSEKKFDGFVCGCDNTGRRAADGWRGRDLSTEFGVLSTLCCVYLNIYHVGNAIVCFVLCFLSIYQFYNKDKQENRIACKSKSYSSHFIYVCDIRIFRVQIVYMQMIDERIIQRVRCTCMYFCIHG